MDYRPLKYKVTKVESRDLGKMGYQTTNNGNVTFEIFMQKFFPNFNILSLLRIVETQFTTTSQTAINRQIFFDDTNGSLRIEYQNEYKNEDDALLFIREFINRNGIIDIKHEYCVIPKNSRNNGLIKPVFQESLQQYININAKRILVMQV